MKIHSIALFALVISCGDNAEPIKSSSSQEECQPGQLDCECVEFVCLEGLTCEDNICTEQIMQDLSCENNDDCSEIELCFNQECTLAEDLIFEFKITRFDPPNCSDGFGSAELIFKYYTNKILEYTSAESTCPGSWPDKNLNYDPYDNFELEFWESDAFENDFIGYMCWELDLGECYVVPDIILSEGKFAEFFDENYIEIVFIPLKLR